MEILNFFTATSKYPDLPKLSQKNLTRSGMALSTRQLYELVMQGRNSTAIVDQHGPQLFDSDSDSFGPDERELATVHSYVQDEQNKVKQKALKELADTSNNDVLPE